MTLPTNSLKDSAIHLRTLLAFKLAPYTSKFICLAKTFFKNYSTNELEESNCEIFKHYENYHGNYHEVCHAMVIFIAETNKLRTYIYN